MVCGMEHSTSFMPGGSRVIELRCLDKFLRPRPICVGNTMTDASGSNVPTIAETLSAERSHVIQHARIERRQFLLTCLVVGAPVVGTIAAIAWACFRPVTITEVALLLAMWFVSHCLGIEIGYHRFFTHRSFEAPAAVRWLLAMFGAFAFQGSPLYWTALHRRHHELSDCPGDPHSPKPDGSGVIPWLKGLWHSHIAWMGTVPLPDTLHYTPDLLKDPIVRWTSNYYYYIAIGGLLLPAAIAGAIFQSWEGVFAGLLWGGVVRLFLSSNFTWCVNSVCHTLGARPYETDDNSRNVALLAIPTFGESWHNNHHALPSSACNTHKWWQIDLSYIVIFLAAKIGLFRQVKVLDPTQFQEKCTSESGS